MSIHPSTPARLRSRASRQTFLSLLVVLTALLLASCGGGDQPASGAPAGSKTFTYTVTDSGGNLLAGRRVVVLNAPVSGTCASPTPGPVQHTADAAVTTPGTVTVSFTLNFPGAYAESIYIDVDGSNTLTAGDLVWGSDPLGFASACIPGMAVWQASQSLDWSAVAAGGPGSTTYGGSAQPFAADGDAAGAPAVSALYEPAQPDRY